LKWDQTENFETEIIQTTRLVHSSGGVDYDEYIKGSLEADGLATEHVIWIRHGRLDEHVLRANRMAKYDHHRFTWMLKRWFFICEPGNYPVSPILAGSGTSELELPSTHSAASF
jgi:hypothetical protein